MNRHQRRAARIRGPKGEPLEIRMLQILERDEQGRPTLTRLCWDDEILGAERAADDGGGNWWGPVGRWTHGVPYIPLEFDDE